MNRECKNPDCPNGKNITMMCYQGTDFCCGNCEKVGYGTAPSTPSPKASPKRRASAKKKAKAT